MTRACGCKGYSDLSKEAFPVRFASFDPNRAWSLKNFHDSWYRRWESGGGIQASPCDRKAQINVQLADRSRIREDERVETPYLGIDRELFFSGGVMVVRAWLNLFTLQDKVFIPDQADIVYFVGHGEEDGSIYLRFDGGDDSKLTPGVQLGNEWSVDVEIVILDSCDLLSLCDSPIPWFYSPKGSDPRCKVKFLENGEWQERYDSAHPPTADPNDNICLSCSHEVSYYGAQRWRGLTTASGGPKLYLGYYNMADARFEAHPNPSTTVVRKLLDEMSARGFNRSDLKIDDWIDVWMEVNKRVMDRADERYNELAGRPRP